MIDIILLTHNKLENTRRCVEALCLNTSVPFKLTVIDDSTDLTPLYFQGMDNVNYVRLDVEIKSCNQVINIGMKLTQSDPFIFLCNSTFVEKRWLMGVLPLMKRDAKVGIVGFNMMSSPNSMNLALYSIPAPKFIEVAMLPWAAVVIRRASLPEGGLDEETYIGFRGADDLDHCLEIRKRGWKIICNRLGIIYHTPTATGGLDDKSRSETEENARRFARKWRGMPILFAAGENRFQYIEYVNNTHSTSSCAWLTGKNHDLDIRENLTDKEAEGLEYLTSRVCREKMIVADIGSWKGFSTAILAKWVIPYKGMVFAVDHWKGNEGTWNYEVAQANDIFAIFKHNMKALELDDVVYPLVMSSQEASKIFTDEIFDLVFIDADHRYDYIMADIEAWLPKIRKGGIL